MYWNGEKNEGHYPQEIIEQGIEMGLHMLQVPEEYGGMGLDTINYSYDDRGRRKS